MPDKYGNLKGISVPRLPWKEEEQVEVINREQQEYDRVRNGPKPAAKVPPVPSWAPASWGGPANRDKPPRGR